ncbi:MAG: GumC family protein [Desulfobacca sp.]|uniref:GumC family protein n=1 Tax=Desulfobacca sp. TaxID=2067990 RepID=UPI0040490FB7
MTGESPQTGRRISLRDVLFIFFYKLPVFELILCFIVVGTILLALLKTPVYQVSGQILVKPLLEPSLKLQAPTATNIRANPVTPQDVNSEVNILRSPQLLRDVVQRLELYRPQEPTTVWQRWQRWFKSNLNAALIAVGLRTPLPPVEQALLELDKRLEIKPVTLSNTISVSLRGESPTEIAKIVNTLMETFIDYHIAIFKAKGAREFYTAQAEFYRQRLEEAEADLEQFKKKWSIIEINAQNETNVELLRVLNENLTLTLAQIKDQETKIGVQVSNLAKTGQVEALTKDLQNNIVEELVRVLGPLMAERERIAVHYQADSDKLRAIDRQIQEIKEKYDRQMQGLVRGAQLDLSGLKKYANTLQENIQKLKDQSVLLSQQQIELDRLLREVKQNEKLYLLYRDKMEEARIEEQQDANRVSNVAVTSWAEPPAVPVFPKKTLMVLLAVVIGSIVGLAGTFVSYYLDHAVKTPEELAWYAGLPVLATVREASELPTPVLEGQVRQSGPPLWMLTPGAYPQLHSDYANMKNNLLLHAQRYGSKVFLFTGPGPGVGVSTTSANLALLLATDLLDQRILLVDGNLADPVVHLAFQKDIAPGLLDYVCQLNTRAASVSTPSRGTAAQPAVAEVVSGMQQVVQSSHLANLDLVTLGHRVPHIVSPYNLKRFSEFLQEAQTHYDLILVDGPPVFSSSHSLIIAGQVDAIVMVVEACRTRYEVVREMAQLLGRHGSLLGGVLQKRQYVIPGSIYKYI